VCPEHIKITDNAIIPMKERVVDRKYDPLVWLGSKIFRRHPEDDQLVQSGLNHPVAAGPAMSGVDLPDAHERTEEQEVERGVNWHRRIAPATLPAVGANGRLGVSEAAFDRSGAASPFGDDIEFPLPPRDLNYAHPEQD
jgi:succinate dehydrogenase / fumarate reductase iron-sulfur subunit